MGSVTRTIPVRRAFPAALALAAVLATAGCGNEPEPSSGDNPSGAEADTSAGKGDWLLAIDSAGGADAERSTTTYLTFNPSSGKTSVRKMPGVTAASASDEDAALLVSTDRKWAIPDTGLPNKTTKSGRLTVYSLSDDGTTVIDLRERAGRDDIKPIAWAFDPAEPDTLRVVDTADRVWRLSVTGKDATQEGTLPKGDWVFTNGFDHNDGKPWVESITTDATKPAGHGVNDKAPVTRDGGTVLPAGSAAMEKLPTSPCEFAAGFTEDSGLTWAFCADKPAVQAYYLPQGGEEWKTYGEPSEPVAPEAATFPLALPPVG